MIQKLVGDCSNAWKKVLRSDETETELFFLSRKTTCLPHDSKNILPTAKQIPLARSAKFIETPTERCAAVIALQRTDFCGVSSYAHTSFF